MHDGYTVGSLCSGFGGLDLGLELAGWKVAWHVENDLAASAVLERHWPGVPNHHDLKAVDWGTVEPVDLICGGYPCQPFSHAGRRRGEADPRHLWPFVCAAIRRLRPRLALLENVAGHRSLGFGRVLGDLAEVGYDATWASVRASDVGAPHGRERVFILAAPADTDGVVGTAAVPGRRGGRPLDRPGTLERVERLRGMAGGAPPADADHAALDGQRARTQPRQGDPAPTDATGVRGDGKRGSVDNPRSPPGREAVQVPPRGGDCTAIDWLEYEPAIRRWEAIFGEPAPHPLDRRGRLNVDLTRWMLGFPPHWHGDTGRTAALRGYGNAVQVQVAELVGRWAAER